MVRTVMALVGVLFSMLSLTAISIGLQEVESSAVLDPVGSNQSLSHLLVLSFF